MKEIIIIGTLHHEFTPKPELEEVLNEINPDKVLLSCLLMKWFGPEKILGATRCSLLTIGP